MNTLKILVVGRNESKPVSSLSALGSKDPHTLFFASDVSSF